LELGRKETGSECMYYYYPYKQKQKQK
jgi:hypothetical protein